MIGSYRIWSAVWGLWYVALCVSMVKYPPGSESTVIVGDDKHPVPSHTTFFQVVVGLWFWTAVFVVLAALLLTFALIDWRRLWVIHSIGLWVTYALAIGYFIRAVTTSSGWTVAAFAGATASGHLLISRFDKMIDANAAKDERIDQLQAALGMITGARPNRNDKA